MANTSPIFFPTTILLVDDNKEFLKALHLTINEEEATFYLFDNPRKILSQLNTLNEESSMAQNITEFNEFSKISVTEKRTDFLKIINYLNSKNRFEKVSTLVVDYGMPEMNGLELCSAIENPFVQKILLTGEADEKVAVEAFNQGIIDAYIRKTDSNCKFKLKEIIRKSQMKYLYRREAGLVDICEKSPLNDPIFLEHFTNILDKLDISEYYSLSSRFDFLLISRTGELHILWVQDENEAYSYYYEIEDFDEIEFSNELKKDMQEYKKMLCFLPMNGEYPEITMWPSFLQPATVIKGEKKKYLTAVTQAAPFISGQKVLSYEEYATQCNAFKYLD